MRTEFRRGQALTEFIVGIFALTLVVSALLLFAAYITANLAVQNSARNPGLNTSGFKNGDSIEVGDFAARWFVGDSSLRVKEKVKMPDTLILE